MSKKTIVLITDYFPYTKDYETFLEIEVEYWAKYKNISLILMPMHSDPYIRNIPEHIYIDNTFSKYLSIKEKEIEQNFKKILYLVKSLTKTIFWKEVFSDVIKQPSLIKELLFSLRKYEIYKVFFKQYLEKNSVDIFYTYWNTEATYALQTLKTKQNYKVVTRVHGFDLYKERTLKNYMPLRKQFTKNIDKVFTITDSAIKYLVDNYGYKQEVISTQRLGVKDRNIVCSPTDEKEFHIVSCSSVINVKQVDKIVDSLVILNDKHDEIALKWTHIGDGELFEVLNNYANKKLSKLNIKYNLLGFLSNSEVNNFYQDNKIDVFINVSKSEGVPVSIMEAMSYHIPIIAPNVGGISDMVIDRYNGLLLENSLSINGIVKSLENISFLKKYIIRENSYKQYKKKYNSKVNYNKFISQMVEIVDV